MIPKTLTQKSASYPARSNPLSGFFDFLGFQGLTGLQAALAIRYYLSASPVSTAIDMIMEPFSEIDPIVVDKNDEEVPDHHNQHRNSQGKSVSQPVCIDDPDWQEFHSSKQIAQWYLKAVKDRRSDP